MARMPPVTQALLWALGIAYLLQYLIGDAFTVPMMLWPLGELTVGVDANGQAVVANLFRPWQLVTYALVHDPQGIAHILLNAIALAQFGTSVEAALGSKRYSILLLVSVVGAGILQLALAALRPDLAHPVLGASGGVYAVLLAFAVLFPRARLMLLFPPIPMSARTLVIVFAAMSLGLGISGAQQGVAHFVHLGGMLFAWGLLRHWRIGALPERGPPPG